MQINVFIEELKNIIGNSPVFFGVPDSKLKALCNYLIDNYGLNTNHVIAANEGNAVAMAAGHYLSAGTPAIVYMQNSGLGNIINPVESLLRIYEIPCIFIIGWRGEPNLHDEPQHLYQGQDTLKTLDLLDIPYMVIDGDTDEQILSAKLVEFKCTISKGKSIAFVIKKNGLAYEAISEYGNDNTMLREDVLDIILDVCHGDVVISTTGKTSRELFELRERKRQSHKFDFLTVGSMGHSSSIALSIAKNKSSSKVWCIDGDGAAIMHMGAMAIIGANKPRNLVHVLINNGAHESVGGMPTVGRSIDFIAIARACGYTMTEKVSNIQELEIALNKAKKYNDLVFLEILSKIGSRKDLGRPTNSPLENRDEFMKFVQTL